MKTIRVPFRYWIGIILSNILWLCACLFLLGWMYDAAIHVPLIEQPGYHLGTDPGVELKDGP